MNLQTEMRCYFITGIKKRRMLCVSPAAGADKTITLCRFVS